MKRKQDVMLKYGKTAQTAISAISVLAESYDGGDTKHSSLDIAQKRDLPRPLVAKLLVTLSGAGLVKGSRGPGGGYWLAREPSTICLREIVDLFEHDHDRILCPFGVNFCPNDNPCPLHDQLWEMSRKFGQFLDDTNLSVFQPGK